MKYYNFETMFRSLRDELREYLKSNNIYFELSSAPACHHFEILTNENGAEQISAFIESASICEGVIH